jgi:hypothetical protein
LAEAVPHLQSLSIRNCVVVALPELVARLPHLFSLTLLRCSYVHAEHVLEMVAPHLRLLQLSETVLLSAEQQRALSTPGSLPQLPQLARFQYTEPPPAVPVWRVDDDNEGCRGGGGGARIRDWED